MATIHLRITLLAGLAVLGQALPVHASSAPVGERGPRRVLIIRSYGEYFEPYRTAAAAFRTELARQSPAPVEFHDVSVETARFDDGAADEPLVEYIRALCSSRPLDLIVPIGSPAVRFCARQRDAIFRSTPVLVTATEERRSAGIDFGPNAAVVGFRVDDPGFVEDILRLLPSTAHVYVVFGVSPLEQYWAAETRREWQRFADRVEFSWLGGLTLPQMESQLAALPPNSAVIFGMLAVDAAAVPYEQKSALERIHATANAPVFGFFAHDLGHGIVGGRLIDVESMAAEAARVAARILGGTPASAIPPVLLEAGAPRFDWRELRRWHIRESQLLAGSSILFREPEAWRVYRWHIGAAVMFVVLEGVLIALLLASRARHREALAQAAELRRELAHTDRVSLVGQFAASLAHELGQPLGAILRNAEAAEMMLEHDSPDVEEVRAILTDIRKDDRRAEDVIERLRRLLGRRSPELQRITLTEPVEDVLSIARTDAAARHVTIATDVPADLPPVYADRVQVQQVLLNLISNAMDAMNGAADAERRVTVRARRGNNGWVEVAVHDTGGGIPADDLARVFDPYHTTKPTGMGMGLSISRTLIEAQGGRLWAENNPGRGATFRFTLPLEPREEHR